MVKISDKHLMPEFTIDSTVTSEGVQIPGIKRMYDIALALQDSIMVWGPPGCIAEGSVIRGRWGGKSNEYKRRGVKIEKIYKGQHNISYPGSYQRKSNTFIVRSYNEVTKNVEDTTVTSTYSGEKQCYEVRTANKAVEATEEHPFLTDNGWVECKDLKVGDTVYTYPIVKTKTDRERCKWIGEVTVKYHPTGTKKVITEKGVDYVYYRKSKHIIEYEANRNGLNYKDYLHILNNYNGEKLYFVPKGIEVHHLDRNRANNTIENVELLSKSEHAKLHHKEDGIYGHMGTYQPIPEKIISITPTTIKKTYDLTCEKNHNFFANDILVHNCGKSQAVQQWNQQKVREYERRIENGEKVKPWNPIVIDVRLSMKEPVDMQGIPIPFDAPSGEKQTAWAIPNMWPRDNGEFSGGVIHLDEMNQGQAAILNAAFQLIQDRALGDYKVPDNYMIIGSANPPAYNGTVTEFSMPLANRFSHFNIKTDPESWLDYRLNNGGNIDVMSFIKTQAMDALFDTRVVESKIGSISDALFTDIVTTPRSWEVIEKLLNLPMGDSSNNGFSMEEKRRYATGRLGIGLANKLFEYLKEKEKYQDWREILVKGKDFRSEDVDQYWAVQMASISAIIGQQDDKVCRQYILNFINATRNLSKSSLKVINITQLATCKRVKGNPTLFSPGTDARDIIKLAAKSLYG